MCEKGVFYTDNGFGGVTSVEHTWWHRVAEMTESEILLNSSYSGSTVSHTGYDGEDYSEFSFAARITELICDGFFEENRVDTLIVYGGLNDCWAGSPRGEIKHEGITDADLYLFYPALSYVIGSVRTASPDTRIIVVIEEQLDTGMKEGIAEIAEYHGCTAVYPTGAELSGSHPTSRGMRTIAEQIVEALSE